MDLLPKLAALGLMGIQFDEQYGGSAMSAVDYCICIEELARVCPAIALSVAAHNGLCTAHINMFGNDAQKAALPAAAGQGRGARRVGADGSERRQRRGRDADDRDAAGGRAGSSTAPRPSSRTARIGGVMVVMAVTDRTKGNRGISAFVLEHGTPGMSAGKKENKLGMRASDTSEVVFQDCRLPVGAAARRGRAGLHQHAAGARRRADRDRGAVGRPRAGRLRSGAARTRRSAGSSASRSPRSRRSSGSSPTPPRRSRRRGCSPIAPRISRIRASG